VETYQEQEFVRRARAGDRAAFAALVDRYWNPVRAWLSGLAGGGHSAEDLAQETFLKAWVALPRLESEDVFRVWLFRIARNEFLAANRSPSSTPGGPLPEAPDPRPGPTELAEESEGAAALRGAIAKLPQAYREAYLLWAHECLPYSEIARILDVTEDVARWRVCEARRRLTRVLEKFLAP
jgi:RNA polymerase sigma-70 factor (ECF subfamily)